MNIYKVMKVLSIDESVLFFYNNDNQTEEGRVDYSSDPNKRPLLFQSFPFVLTGPATSNNQKMSFLISDWSFIGSSVYFCVSFSGNEFKHKPGYATNS